MATRMNEVKGYQMSVDTAERFFRLCALWDLHTYDERMALLNKLLHEEDIVILTEERLMEMLKNKKGFYIQ